MPRFSAFLCVSLGLSTSLHAGPVAPTWTAIVRTVEADPTHIGVQVIPTLPAYLGVANFADPHNWPPGGEWDDVLIDYQRATPDVRLIVVSASWNGYETDSVLGPITLDVSSFTPSATPPQALAARPSGPLLEEIAVPLLTPGGTPYALDLGAFPAGTCLLLQAPWGGTARGAPVVGFGVASVPEPSTATLAILGLAMAGALAQRRDG